MNLNAIANGYIIAVTPNMTGELRASTGFARAGDALFTGSIAGDVLTVTAVSLGTLAVDSVLTAPLVIPSTLIRAQLSGPPGGTGTYRVSLAQTVASGAIAATGTGERVATYAAGVVLPMQVQAVTGEDLKHLDGLNIQGIMRTVYINGRVQGVNRQAIKGGDVIALPTGLTVAPPLADIWLVTTVLEPWDTPGWCKVLVTLQATEQAQ